MNILDALKRKHEQQIGEKLQKLGTRNNRILTSILD
jgi:hypothetical protein